MNPRNVMGISSRPVCSRGAPAFALIEVIVAIGVVGVLFLALYNGLIAGFSVVRASNENLRATQIMLDRMEEMRLYSWQQISSFGSVTSYIPPSFAVPYYPGNASSNSSSGFFYYGTLDITNAPFSGCSYSNDIKSVTVTLKWTNAIAHQRTMTTSICQYGMQNYIY